MTYGRVCPAHIKLALRKYTYLPGLQTADDSQYISEHETIMPTLFPYR